MVPQPPIFLCAAWGAKPPRSRAPLVGRPVRALVHHTAGHHREIRGPANESKEELFRYARDIQAFHMAPGGLGAPHGGTDSGHNFLIGYNGVICEGRHGSFAACRRGLMVASAHCPGENDQPGVEHEHAAGERMSDAQAGASVWLYAWLCDRAGIRPTQLYGHRAFYATECPDTIPVLWLRAQVAALLNEYGRGRPSRAARLHLATGGRFLR